MDDVLEGGPGWGVHRVTQKMVATDPGLLRKLRTHTADSLDKVGYSIALGEVEQAREHLAQSPDCLRKKIFTGDVLRDEGRFAEAARLFTDALEEAAGTPQEAAVLMHHGKSLFMEGRYGEAVRYLTDALAGLRADGRDRLGVAFAELALTEARRRIGSERAGANG